MTTDGDDNQNDSEDGSEAAECPHCNGKGYVPLTEDDPEYERLKEKYGDNASWYINLTEKRCICTKKERFRQEVGEDIYQAEILEESVLWDRTGEDLFIKSYQTDFRPHLRYVLARKGLDYFYRVTTDAKLRDVYVGEDEEYNSLAGHVENPTLLIIDLAILSYKNTAMPGILQESLRIRRHEGKATWVVNPPDEPFQEGHEAYSPSAEAYVNEHFKKLKIEGSSAEEINSVDEERADSKNLEKNAFQNNDLM
jgi:hypothetical protein